MRTLRLRAKLERVVRATGLLCRSCLPSGEGLQRGDTIPTPWNTLSETLAFLESGSSTNSQSEHQCPS